MDEGLAPMAGAIHSLRDAPEPVPALLDVLPGPIFMLDRSGSIVDAWCGVDAPVANDVLDELNDVVARLPVPVGDLLKPEVAERIVATITEALDTKKLCELTYPQFMAGRERTIHARCLACGPDVVLWFPTDLSDRLAAREVRAVQRAYEEATSARVAFETLLAASSQRLLTANDADLDDAIQECLADIAQHFGADVAHISTFSNRGVLELVAQWRGPNAPAPQARSSRVRRGEFSFSESVLAAQPMLFIRDVEDLAGRGDAEGEQRLMSLLQDRSLAWVRIGPPDDQQGIIGLSWKAARYEGPAEPVRGLVRLGEAILGALNRREAERLLAGQRRVLEMVAGGATLANSLIEIARLREEPRSSLRCAVLLYEDASDGSQYLTMGAAPLPSTDAPCNMAGLRPDDLPVERRADSRAQAWAVAELPSGPLVGCLSQFGANTVVLTPIRRAHSEVPSGVLVTMDLDPDPRPVIDTEVDDICAALASLAIDRAASIAELSHQATHDPLTGIANRSALLDRLDVALRRARQGESIVAVMVCDLDRFKEVNDLVGRTAGDGLLREVASRISAAIGPTDTVARFGGDEYVVMAGDIHDEDDALALADRVAAAVSGKPFVVGGSPMRVTLSIGVAISAGGMDHPEALLRDADVAMYRAKAGGRARREVFRVSGRLAARDREQLAQDLARAMHGGGLEVHYQPLLDLVDGHVSAVEALVRWPHPTKGLISPDVFIPIAEETGLIVELGRWVADQAVQQVAALAEHRPSWAGMRMHVNLSARQLAEPGFVDDLRDSLARWDVPAKQVALEITETVLMADSPATAAAIQEMVELGADLVLDDFGTGYASLTYLRRFPVRGLKIDRSFVSGLGQTAEDDAVVRAVVDMARSLDLDLVAEGVETSEQAEFLREINCQAAQGYFFARPTPPAELIDVLSALDGD